jgi:spermidine synthase
MSAGAADVAATGRTAAPPSAESPFLPALLFLFVGSGAAALIYQIVWFQMLSLIIGSSAISLGLLLATFMGGMCIGSLMLSRVVSPARHPLRVYAMIEGGIGVFGLLVLALLPLVGSIYAALGGSGLSGMALRAVMSVICLLPPTILMGATLPAIARWVEATPTGVSWLGFFYAGNIAGAVFGTLLAGFYLLRVFDVTVSTMVAVAINAAVSLVGFSLSKATRHVPPSAAAVRERRGLAPGTWPVYVTIGLSGLTALGSEVLWTRLLSLAFGGTVYTFSLILAGILLGLGIGSSIGSFAARNSPNPRTALGVCQLLLIGMLAWAAFSMTDLLPYWPINPNLSKSPWFTFQIDFVRALWTVLPAAILWGASFPLALAAVTNQEEDPGQVVGGVYAANTVGAIIGSLSGALLVIGVMGTQQGQRLLIVIAAVSALLMLAPVVDRATGALRMEGRSVLWGVITVGAGLWFASTVNPVPGILVAYGRYSATWVGSEAEYVFVGEGTHSSMAVTRAWNGVMNYHNAGKVQASSEPQDMRLQRMLGHLTTLIPDSPKEVLVIGFGAGVTAGAVSVDPRVQRVTIAEIERLVPEVVSTYFSDFNFGVATNPKTDIHIDDARHYLLTTDRKFDAITSDPFDPWVKGAATLYTKEYFEVMKDHLNPGGVVTVFVQLYQAGLEAVKSEVATFVDVFPNAVVFQNTHEGAGYDLVMVGQVDGTTIDLDRWDQLLAQPEMQPVAQSLSEIGVFSADDLVASYGGRGPELKPWLADAQINGDRNLRLQYLAGMGLNRFEQDLIYRQMSEFRTFPEGLFKTSDPTRLDNLRNMMGLPSSAAAAGGG